LLLLLLLLVLVVLSVDLAQHGLVPVIIMLCASNMLAASGSCCWRLLICTKA
jgi:hypothetical protein